MDKKVPLKFFTLMAGHTHGSYNLILQEIGGSRKVPIIVGTFEAQSIATEIEGIIPQRPLTHDLIVSIINSLDVELKEVLIYDLQNGIFFSRLVLSKAGLSYDVDARTSDAIAVAIRTKSPIYIEQHLMHEISIEEKELFTGQKGETPERESETAGYSHFSKEELKNMLEEAVEAEDYIKAALVRDELNKRK